MARITLLLLSATVLAAPAIAQDSAPAFADDGERIGYCLGADIGKQIKKNPYALNIDALVAGIKDAYAGGEMRADEATVRQAIQDFQTKSREAAAQKGKELEAQGADFLAKNATAEGVKVTESGLQYKVIKEGTGAIPTANDTVRVHYTGTLIDGEKFDSSRDRGEPAEFPVTGVIKGWTEALQLMKEGSQWQLFIPANLAYGERGTGPIPANATLIFDVELLEIVKDKASGSPQIEIR